MWMVGVRDQYADKYYGNIYTNLIITDNQTYRLEIIFNDKKVYSRNI